MTDLSSTPLRHRIGLALAKIGTALRHRSWEGGAAEGLTPTQGQIIAQLDRHPGQTLRAVADALSVRPATASEAVATLERKGLLTKVRDPADRRRLRLHLTAAGTDKAAATARWPDFLGDVVEDLPTSEQRVLLRALLGVIRRLQTAGHIPVAQMCINCVHFRPNAHDDAERPHHCAFVDAPFGDLHLRIDCSDHSAADADAADAAWRRLTAHATAT